jgi:hypothetical protein
MKRLLIATSVAAVLAGCSTVGNKSMAQTEPLPSPTPAVIKDQTVAAQGKLDAPMTIDIPAWYIKAPASTEDYVFLSGTGYSSDLSMSHQKALLDAQVKLADKINGVVNALMKQYKTDNSGTVGTDKTSLTVKKLIADTAITGYHIEDSRVVSENRSYRTFVLIRYPIGDANRLLKDKRQQETQNQSNEDAAQNELEQELNARKKPVARPKTDPAVTAPQSKAEPVKAESLAQVESVPAPAVLESRQLATGPVDLNGNSVTKLMDISDPKIRAIRDQAAAKPGAIVEQITIR